MNASVPHTSDDPVDLSRRLVRSLFSLLGVILVALGVYAFLKFSEQREQQYLRADLEALTSISTLLSALQDAETGQRGYLLTGNDNYLAAYRAGTSNIPRTIADLRTRLHGADTLLLDEVERLAVSKLAELAEVIARYHEQSPESAWALVKTDRGKHLMDRLRAQLNELRARTLSRADGRFERIRALIFWLWVIVVVTVGLLVWITVSVYRRVRPFVEGLAYTNKKLLQRERELEQKNEQLENFAYIASHDLKEPVRTMTGFVQLLREDYDQRLDATAHEYLGFIERAGLRLQSMIDGLLRYARVGSTGASEPVDLNILVETILADFKSTIVEKRATVRVEKLPVSYGRPLELRQLFQNLLANALKFHPPEEPPRVEISATARAEYDEIRIRDAGIGIDPKFHDSVFQVFRRLHRREEYEGTGIGLAYCRKVVESHGGSIRVESALGVGTTFVVFLPKF